MAGKHTRRKKTSTAKKIFAGLGLALLLCATIAATFLYFRPDVLDGFLEGMQTTSSSSESSSQASRESSGPNLPNVSSSDWSLVLVNRNHIQEEQTPELAQVGDIQVDSRIAEATSQFLAEAQTIAPGEVLISGYRSRAEQEELYNESVAEAESAGLSREDAETFVQTQVQLPGASEHQTGLAIDMSVPEGQEDEVAARIAAIAPKYGFVLRYPEGKSQVTGVDFESWHYRYVGVESAQYMSQNNLVLEEYIAQLRAAGK